MKIKGILGATILILAPAIHAGEVLTEDPSPVNPLMMVTIDLTPRFAWGAPVFTNPEILSSVIVPRGYGLKIIAPVETDGECSNSQVRQCKTLCGKRRQMSIGCDLQVEWQQDGSALRTITCTCASPSDPRVAGSRTSADAYEIHERDIED